MCVCIVYMKYMCIYIYIYIYICYTHIELTKQQTSVCVCAYVRMVRLSLGAEGAVKPIKPSSRTPVWTVMGSSSATSVCPGFASRMVSETPIIPMVNPIKGLFEGL